MVWLYTWLLLTRLVVMYVLSLSRRYFSQVCVDVLKPPVMDITPKCGCISSKLLLIHEAHLLARKKPSFNMLFSILLFPLVLVITCMVPVWPVVVAQELKFSGIW